MIYVYRYMYNILLRYTVLMILIWLRTGDNIDTSSNEL